MWSLKGAFLFALFINGYVCTSPQCKNERGEPVDWFYMYKLPTDKTHSNPLISSGAAYMYLTPPTVSGWILSDIAVGDPNSMLGKTLDPLYQDTNLVSVLYNDQPPPISTETDTGTFSTLEGGHTKGVVLGDRSTSVWIVHSVPHFPPVPDTSHLNRVSYSYPATGLRYGQSVLCISVNTTVINQIAVQLKYNEPLIVQSRIPAELEKELPDLVDVVRNKTVDTEPWSHTQSFDTLAGRRFLSFAKSGLFHDDLYSGLVAVSLQSDLLVESWINGPGVLDSECTRKFQVKNVEGIKIPAADLSFSSHHDHSKWAVSVAHAAYNSPDNATYWLCVGDINRALSQELRGGGTVCTSSSDLWRNFAHFIDSVKPCNKGL